MQRYDVLAVPSQWLETGPLVVMEAFAAGVPVLGSNLGGIGELVTSGVDGLLVEPASIVAWRTALEALCRDRELLSGFAKEWGSRDISQKCRTICRRSTPVFLPIACPETRRDGIRKTMARDSRPPARSDLCN